MTLINDMLRMLQNKLAHLNNQRSSAAQVGDMLEVERIDVALAEVDIVIEKLRD